MRAARPYHKCDRVCKPGSVFCSHLSRRRVAAALKPPPRDGRVGLVCPSTALLRIEFTAPFRLRTMGELLPRLSTLTYQKQAVYLCCTCPKVTLGGRYPLSLPCGARTFLMHGVSPCARGCVARSRVLFYYRKCALSTSFRALDIFLCCGIINGRESQRC